MKSYRGRCFLSCHDSGTKRKFFVPTRNPTSELWIFLLLKSLPSTKLTICLILTTNNILLTSLILAICWMHVIYELCNRPCSPWNLCGSVIQHQSTKKSRGLRSWGPRNVLYQAQNLKSILFYLQTLCC